MSPPKEGYTQKGDGVYTDSSDDDEIWEDCPTQTSGLGQSLSQASQTSATSEAFDALIQQNKTLNDYKNVVKTFGWLASVDMLNFSQFFEGLDIINAYFMAYKEYGPNICMMAYFIEFKDGGEAKKAILKHMEEYEMDGRKQHIKVSKLGKPDIIELTKRIQTNHLHIRSSFFRMAFISKITENDVEVILGGIKINLLVVKKVRKYYDAYIKLDKSLADHILSKNFVIDDKLRLLHPIDAYEFQEKIKLILTSSDQSRSTTLPREVPNVLPNLGLCLPLMNLHDPQSDADDELMPTSRNLLHASFPKPKPIQKVPNVPIRPAVPISNTNSGISTWTIPNIVGPMYESIKTVQGLISSEEYIIHTHLRNAINYVDMVERKMKHYQQKIRELEKEKEELTKKLGDV